VSDKKTNSNKIPVVAIKCRRKFLRFFPKGFQDEKYYNWERGYKWQAHEQWMELLDRPTCYALLQEQNFTEIAARAIKIESKTNLLFSFEKMAIRDAIKPPEGARLFAEGLVDFLYGKGSLKAKFERWCNVVAQLPRRQTRVLTWPVLTVFGFIAQPDKHIFLKPMITRLAASEYGFDFHYKSQPSIETYTSLLEFANLLQHDLSDMHPKDMIDIQSFIWVQASSEYDE
jgi:hypothetical protein